MMCKQDDLEYLLKCLYQNTFEEKFNSILEKILNTDYELTLKLIVKGIVQLVNDRVAYEVHSFISFIESELNSKSNYFCNSISTH